MQKSLNNAFEVLNKWPQWRACLQLRTAIAVKHFSVIKKVFYNSILFLKTLVLQALGRPPIV